MTAKSHVCPCCFAVSQRDDRIALGQASRCPQCGESVFMDPCDDINMRAPPPRPMVIGAVPSLHVPGSTTARTRGSTRAAWQIVFGLVALVGLGICLISGGAAAYLFYRESAYKPIFGVTGEMGFILIVAKLVDCAAVFGIAVVGGMIQLVAGPACRRWPRSMTALGIGAAIFGMSPLMIQMVLTVGGIVDFLHLLIYFGTVRNSPSVPQPLPK